MTRSSLALFICLVVFTGGVRCQTIFPTAEEADNTLSPDEVVNTQSPDEEDNTRPSLDVISTTLAPTPKVEVTTQTEALTTNGATTLPTPRPTRGPRPTFPPDADAPCPPEWFPFGDHCYQWSGSDQVETWFAAELNCRRDGAHLVSLESRTESELVRGITFCRTDYWVGLVNTEYEGGRFGHPSGWQWWDGNTFYNYSRMTFENKPGFYCTYATPSGNWSNSYCSQIHRPWVCKMPNAKSKEGTKGVITPTTSEPLTKKRYSCPKGWSKVGPHCYWLSPTTANYFHAQLTCEMYHAHVVTIQSHYEQAYLQALAGCDKPFWIGLEKAKPCLTQKSAVCWEWTDLTPVRYLNWRFAPNGSGECAFSQGYWENSKACSDSLHFVCKRRAIRR